MNRTPLFDDHRALGARMIPFGEWEMPERYTGTLEEHRATRSAAGLFDLSHMGEFFLSGPAALALLRYLLTNDPAGLQPDTALYSPLCNDAGGIVDDVILYRLGFSDPHYLLVVNATTIARDLAWITAIAERLGLTHDLRIDDRSAETALIALQGPRAEAILQHLLVDPLHGLAAFRLLSGTIDNQIEVMVARTGYTGEDGFELFVSAAQAPTLWRRLLEVGRPEGLLPVGLGARDTLRLEARLPLYGSDIDETTSPLEAGLTRFVTLDRPDFCGREPLLRQQQDGPQRRLVGLELLDRAIPRSHYAVQVEGRTVGQITSGTFAPTLGKGIALAYLPSDLSAIGTEVTIDIRSQPHPARVVKTPFYRRPRPTVG